MSTRELDPKQLDPMVQFIEDLGLSVEEDGMPRIAGRILGLLTVEEDPLRFDEIAERLQVSRASVSTNTRLLEQLGFLERFTVRGERRDFFRLTEDIHGRLLEKSLQRLLHRQAMVDRCIEQLTGDRPEAERRLSSMSRFYRLATESTERFIERWRMGDASTPDESPDESLSPGAASS